MIKFYCVLLLLTFLSHSEASVVNSLPIVSQAKSLVQVIAGDVEGARKTQKDFIETAPIASQIKSIVHLAQGDHEKAKETQKKFLNVMADIADGVPVVGHAKGGVHYAMGDQEAGDNSMKSASRSAGVLLGGAAGGLAGGPPGAVAGGIAAGLAMDGIITGIESGIRKEYSPNGILASVADIVETKNETGKVDAGKVFDTVVGVAGDGLAGRVGGKVSRRLAGKNTKNLYRVASTEEANNALANKKLQFSAKNSPVNAEKWLSESLEHSKLYLKGRVDRSKILKIKVKEGFYNKLKRNMVKQQNSRSFNLDRVKQGQKPRNLFNKEKLGDLDDKVNIGIKGDKNLADLNQNIVKINPINID